ncbi:tudor and KH domain-containing protein homolog isoform X2 [Lycorma delicatula]
MKIPKASVGVVIGRGGSNIKEIELKSDTKINFKDSEDDETRTCIIRGGNEAVHLAEAMIHELIMNQPLIETYEMWVPQRVMGRIIGHGGGSIREISSASNAKISADRTSISSSDGERRIVIKGTSEQIAVAKSLIEEKVEEDAEARRKLEISIANRSPRTKPNKGLDAIGFNSKDEVVTKKHCFEKLVSVSSDGFLEVYVSAVESPSKFWVQMISPKTVELDHLVDQMTDYYQLPANREIHEIKEVKHGQIVAAPFSFDEKWYRAEVCNIDLDDYDPKESDLHLHYVDYGDTGIRKQHEVCQLRTDFLKLRFQAVECSLAHVKPSGDNWSEEATDYFEEINHVALWRPLKAHIVSYRDSEREGSPVPCVELYDTSGPKDIDIGDELIAKGFAVSDEKQDSIKIKQESSSGKNLIEQTSNSEVNGKLNNLKLNLNLDIDTSP